MRPRRRERDERSELERKTATELARLREEEEEGVHSEMKTRTWQMKKRGVLSADDSSGGGRKMRKNENSDFSGSERLFISLSLLVCQ